MLNLDKIINLGIKKVIDRGTAIVLEETEDSIFVRDRISDAFMIAAGDVELGKEWLYKHEQNGYSLVTLFDKSLACYVMQRYGLEIKLDCFQAAYQKKELPTRRIDMKMKAATFEDLSMIMQNYEWISKDEMKEIINRQNLFLGLVDNKPVGFVGEHLEGSMGILYVYPEFRENGYGSELEKMMIIRTLEQGYTPFCQIEINNKNSLKLQRKLGLNISDEHVYWLF